MKKFFSTFLCAIFALNVFAMTGQEVLDKVENNYQNMKDEKSTFSMSITDDKGNVTGKEFMTFLYKKDENTIFAIMRFTSPQSEKNLTLLLKGSDQIYLYMPAFRATKRISGSAKNDKFAGSDFTYKDMELIYKVSDKNYTTNLMKEDDRNYYLEITHNDKELDFEKMHMTIDKNSLTPKFIEFYNWQNEMYKTISFDELKEIQNDGEKLEDKHCYVFTNERNRV